MGNEAQLRKIFEAMGDDGVEGIVEAREIERFNDRGVAVDVVLKVLSKQAGAVPWETTRPWLQEEARAFDAAEAEDVPACLKNGLDVGKGATTHTGGGLPIGHQLHGAGVEPEVDVGMSGKGLVVKAGEVRLGAPA